MTTMAEMGFQLLIETVDGEEFGYAEPEDMGFSGDEVLQVTFEGGKRHHFDVEELASIVLIRPEAEP